MVGTNSDLLVVLVIDSENGEKYFSQESGLENSATSVWLLPLGILVQHFIKLYS